MARGLSSPQSGTGMLLHAVGMNYRITGSGNFRTSLLSLDAQNDDILQNIPMAAKTNREPFILANFTEQGIQIYGRTTAFDETFTVSKIVIFIKPVAEEYPLE